MAGSSLTEIYNEALGILGVSKITNASNPGRTESILNGVWNSVRRRVLADHHWNCARGLVELELHDTEPIGEWDYQFTVPEYVLKVIHLNPTRGEPSTNAFELGVLRTETAGDPTITRVLRTDASEAIISCVIDNESTGTYSPGLVKAFANELARATAPQFGKNAASLRYLQFEADRTTGEAKAVDGQEGSPPVLRTDQIVRARQS